MMVSTRTRFGALVRHRMAALISLIVAATLLGCNGDRAATADVAGGTYVVTGIDGVHLQAADLAPHAPIIRIDMGTDWLLDRTAYAVSGVDPARVLVIKLRQDVTEPNAPPSEFMLLLRGSDAIRLLCPFIGRTGSKAPVDCD